jgi:hypothetical protein
MSGHLLRRRLMAKILDHPAAVYQMATTTSSSFLLTPQVEASFTYPRYNPTETAS